MKRKLILVLVCLLPFGLSIAQFNKTTFSTNRVPSYAKKIINGEHPGNPNLKVMSSWALPSDGSTSGNTRAPGNTFKYQRTEYLITAAEMAASGFPSGYTIDGIGFLISSAGGTSQTGTFTVYLKNTTDATYTLGSTWTTTGFTTVSNIASWTVPIAAGAYTVNFSGGSPFTYTGGGVYVAWEFSNTGTAGATALVANCNTSLTGGLMGYRGTSSGTALTASNYRPATQFVNNTLIDIANITNIYTLEKVAVGYGTPTPISVRVLNASASPATFDVTLTVKDPGNTITRFTSTQTVTALAGNTSTILTFNGWTPTIIENVNITATTSVIPTETFLVNNTRTIQSSVNNQTLGYNYSTTNASGFGFTYPGTGLFASKFHMNGTGNVNGANLLISTDAASTGDTIYAVVLNSSGVIAAQSSNYIITSGDLGTNKSFTFSPSPSFINEDFYIGFAQTKGVAQWYPVGTIDETPQRAATFYTAAITGGTLTELPVSFNLKYGIEAIVGAPPAIDGGVSDITSPLSTCSNLSATENIVVTIENFGSSAISGFPVSYKINNNTPVTVTYSGSIAAGGSASYTFSGANAANLSVPGSYVIKAYTSVPGDANHTNDTTTSYLSVGSASIPYSMGFEDNEDLTGWSILDANTDNFTWGIYTGAKYAHSGTGFAAYGYNTDETTAANDWLFTKCLNLSAGTNYILKFYYRALLNTYPEGLNVNIGTTNSVAGMTTQIVDLPSISDTTYPLSSTTFTVSSSGSYFIGFHCKSAANMAYLMLDDILIDISTGIAENNSSEISVYPNPARNILYVDNAKDAIIEIYNIFGTLINRNENADFIQTFNISELPSGTYIVRILKDGEIINKKINIIK